MTMWAYLDLHPWWALVFLAMIAGTAIGVAENLGRRR